MKIHLPSDNGTSAQRPPLPHANTEPERDDACWRMPKVGIPVQFISHLSFSISKASPVALSFLLSLLFPPAVASQSTLCRSFAVYIATSFRPLYILRYLQHHYDPELRVRESTQYWVRHQAYALFFIQESCFRIRGLLSTRLAV